MKSLYHPIEPLLKHFKTPMKTPVSFLTYHYNQKQASLLGVIVIFSFVFSIALTLLKA